MIENEENESTNLIENGSKSSQYNQKWIENQQDCNHLPNFDFK